MTLLLGATGAGKTLLLKRLEIAPHISKNGTDLHFEEMPPTIPTVGTNLVTVSVGRRQEITVREVGGCMGPIWKNYLKDAHNLLYVIDVADRLQVAASCVQLLSVLAAESLPLIPVLIVFNKIDMPDRMSPSEIESLFRLKDIAHCCGRKFDTVEVSSCSGKGLGEIISWMDKNTIGK
ncbi:ARL16-like protein [Mya arenaria]|uniref:ARL16-like protein n=1 Tax=Mya arenaria TaxID=6604 RepID=A0ABY7DIC9_MYAAR|nr:ADP-ribosylation factor-like protein 16 [Mya arenaria]WAQ96465.1 ARL16-like protein [Mya arenaria]